MAWHCWRRWSRPRCWVRSGWGSSGGVWPPGSDGLLPPARVPDRPRRPIELIARDAQRLGLGFRHVQQGGVSFAQFEGRRRAYDLVLAEACASLSVEHLLAVLPPGVELDAERRRVERVLEQAGLRLDDAA